MNLARTTHGVTFDPSDSSTVPPPWAVPAPPAPAPPKRKRETAREAGERLGVAPSVLYDRAKKRGAIKRGRRGSGRPPKGKEVRLPPEAWDSAAELFSSREIRERRAAGGAMHRITTTKLLLGVMVKMAKPGAAVDRSAIVLAAWKAYPLHFGLRGHENDAPCSHSVAQRLGGGEMGLMTNGLVESLGGGSYRVTAKGREAWGAFVAAAKARKRSKPWR